MTLDESPVCARHEGGIPMSLRSIHSDATRPDTAVGLFECPECGFERRLPLSVRKEAE
jgi:hypothetical protein